MCYFLYFQHFESISYNMSLLPTYRWNSAASASVAVVLLYIYSSWWFVLVFCVVLSYGVDWILIAMTTLMGFSDAFLDFFEPTV